MTSPSTTGIADRPDIRNTGTDHLSPNEKARVILRALRQPPSSQPGKAADGAAQSRKTPADIQVLQQVVGELLAEIGANADHRSPKRARASTCRDKGWDQLPVTDLARHLLAQHPCTAATVLWAQTPARARSVLTMLPRAQARRVGLALVLLNNKRWRPSETSSKAVHQAAQTTRERIPR